jgi:hypothetical protein
VAIGLGKVKPCSEVSFGGMAMCLDRKGQGTVTGAHPVHPTGGIRIDEFGVPGRPGRR